MASDSDDELFTNPNAIFDTLPPEMRPEAILTPEEGEKLVQARRTELLGLWDKLHSIVIVHEMTIRKRWAKVRMAR